MICCLSKGNTILFRNDKIVTLKYTMDHPSLLNCIKLYETDLLSTTVDDLVS